MSNQISNTLDFKLAHFEICDKETESIISSNEISILEKPITYLKENKNIFIYLDSKAFENIGIDTVSLELDDLFGTYNVMLGIKLQKKYSTKIRDFLNNELGGLEPKFSLLFNQDDGLWDLNFPLNNKLEFSESLTINEAFNLTYNFIENLFEKINQ
ncbi:MAG: hypothetical protein K0S34_119 [Bacillales bacterium]|jgi:hypothetical protein|nr:hypothetical protein [Bacillales bacterium]